MQAQDMGARASAEAATDAMILTLLIEARAPWSLDEIGRELDRPESAVDVVHRLTTAGLVHRLGSFVFPTRAAVRAAQLPLEP